MNTIQTFKPRPSTGWLWLVLIGVTVLLLSNMAALTTGFSFSNPVITAVSILGVVIFLISIALAALFPQMHYDLLGDHLALMYGPFQLYRIPYKEIRKMSWQDLAISPVSSVRLPGLALFSVIYSDEGVVKMCATSAATRILLIRTRNSTYGITPAAEELFVNALTKKIKG